MKAQLAASTARARPETTGSVPAIFHGFSFWITGRTSIPDQELKQMITEHGGNYEPYGFTRVTHIIADNLALGNQTWRQLKSRVKKTSVITSAWVTESIKQR